MTPNLNALSPILHIRILRCITDINPPSPATGTPLQPLLLDVKATRLFPIRAHVPQLLALHITEFAF